MTIFKQLQLTSLRWRIYFGFAVIIGILCMAGAASFFGLSKSMALFSEYRSVEDVNQTTLRVDREVQVLKLRVNQFVASGNTAHQASMLEQAEQLKQLIEEVLPAVEDKQMSELLVGMLAHLGKYRDQFELVAEERKLRSQLLRESLPDQGEQVRLAFDLLSMKLDSSELISARISVLSAQRFFIEAQQDALRYFASPDSQWVNRATSALDSARDCLNAITFGASPELLALRENAIAVLDDYEQMCLRAVQATRGYLYLVHVVMAGEASEFAYSSNRLKQLSEQRRLEIGEATIQATQLTKRLTGAFLGIALVVGIVISGRLAYGIVRPITDITKTFKQLADGETSLEIPGINRSDELGEMASAASVFSEKNRQTELLLEQSRQLGEELKSKAIEMEQVNLELDNFAYVASHDLRSPLRGISQLSSWVLEDASDHLPQESNVHLQKLQARVNKLDSMLSNLLDYSRVGHTEESSILVDTRVMLCEVTDLIDKPDGMTFNIGDQMPILKTVRTPLEQVFINLLTNAIKHHDRPESGTIEVEVEEQEDFFCFSVRDDGPGIDPKQHQRIFQMYQRVGSIDVEGCGMGLAIIKKQIELRGGTIEVESTIGEGATFRFTWPKQFVNSNMVTA